MERGEKTTGNKASCRKDAKLWIRLMNVVGRASGIRFLFAYSFFSTFQGICITWCCYPLSLLLYVVKKHLIKSSAVGTRRKIPNSIVECNTVSRLEATSLHFLSNLFYFILFFCHFNLFYVLQSFVKITFWYIVIIFSCNFVE